MLQVAAYCRVSTDKDDQANSFESQQRYFKERIDREPNWDLQGIYADEGLSGTNTKKRVQFNRMIRAAREHKIDLIITKEVSRFARNTVDALSYTRELKSLGIGVIFLNDGIDTMASDGELRLSIMSTMAQEESRKTSSRVKWGQMRCMERGVVFGGSLLGYDVVNGQMFINEEGAKTVRLIFRKYLQERKGSSTIARELREEGIPSSRGNVNWSAPTVLKILNNEKYCGDLVQKKTYTPDFLSHAKKYNHGQEEQVVIRDHHTPIIDRETWDAVQSELHRRRATIDTSGHGNRYPLSGKIKCGECGKSFVSRTKKRRDGSSYKRWCCFKATTEGSLRQDGAGNPLGCNIGRLIREDTAMDILRRSVAAITLDRPKIVNSLTRIVEQVLRSGNDDFAPQLRRLEYELEKLQKKKSTILDRFFDQTLSKEDFRFANTRCDTEINETKSKIDAIKKRQALEVETKSLRPDIRQVISSIVIDQEADDAFYGHLLDHMTVFRDGRVEVALKLLPTRWLYVLNGVVQYQAQMGVQYDSSVPISVSRPLASA